MKILNIFKIKSVKIKTSNVQKLEKKQMEKVLGGDSAHKLVETPINCG